MEQTQKKTGIIRLLLINAVLTVVFSAMLAASIYMLGIAMAYTNTEYADGYGYFVYKKVEIGCRPEALKQIMGAPLEVEPVKYDNTKIALCGDPERKLECWEYTKQVDYCGNYLICHFVIDVDQQQVIRKTRTIYWD